MNDKEALFKIIEERVYSIRGHIVMLDRDLAGLYGVETKRLNEAVKRNLKRFDSDDTMFQITQIEYNESLRSQIATSKDGYLHTGRGGVRYLPFAFTELGVAKLSSILDSDIAIRVNDQIMRYFIHMRKLELTNNDLRKYIETKFQLIDGKIKGQNEVIKDIIDHLRRTAVAAKNKSPKRIGFYVE